MKKILAFLLIILPLTLALISGAEFLLGYEVYRQVEYGELDCEVMDIFIPKEAYKRQTNGCVLLIHGGSGY